MTSRPHTRPRLVLAVAAGGAVGSSARAAIGAGLGTVGGWPVGTLVVNVVGAFLLGGLLEWLSRLGPETPKSRLLRLGVGTGALGGFTTFSSLALEIERLLTDGMVAIACGYAAVTVTAGILAVVAGIAVASKLPGGDR